eukprot:5255122-Pleurochrysis_carterae.AAC.3
MRARDKSFLKRFVTFQRSLQTSEHNQSASAAQEECCGCNNHPHGARQVWYEYFHTSYATRIPEGTATVLLRRIDSYATLSHNANKKATRKVLTPMR